MDIGAEVRFRPVAGTPRQIKGAVLEPAASGYSPGRQRDVETAKAFLRSKRGLLRIHDPDQELKLYQYQTDGLSRRHLRFSQKYQGLEVWPAELIVHLDDKGDVDMMDGAYVPSPRRIVIQPVLDADDAIERARMAAPGGDKALASDPTLIIYAQSNRPLRLAWKLELSISVASHWLVVIDALNGATLSAYNQVINANVSGSGRDLFGATQPLNVWRENSIYYIADTTKPMYDEASDPRQPDPASGVISVWDARNQPISDDGLIVYLVESSSATSGWLPEGVSAAYNLSETYDYYLERHNRNSFDDEGSSIRAAVRLDYNNAGWISGSNWMIFGAGEPYAGALDVVAHELTHGVTQYTANLEYKDQSGALNEAFSDIFGEAVEAYSSGTVDWINGGSFDPTGRSLRDPSSVEIAFGRYYPSKMSEFITPNDPFLDNFRYKDYGGVHLNMTIVTHAFYLLAEGLDGAIGIDDAERIFYRALAYHLVKMSQFVDARLACIASAEELFGVGSNQALKTQEAFDAVEIFDDTNTPDPSPVPAVSGPDATLFVYWDSMAWSYFLGRREEALGDPSIGVQLFERPAKMSPPSVTGDGSFAVFIDSLDDLCLAFTDPLIEESCMGWYDVSSVAMSPDGNLYSFVFLDQYGYRTNRIAVFDLRPGGETRLFDLVAPVMDGDYSINTIRYADAMDFTADGKYLYYDAFNVIGLADGSEVGAWSIYAIDLMTGETFAVLPPVPGLEIGWPELAQTSSSHITFSVNDEQTGESAILGVNLTTGAVSVIASDPQFIGVPCYTGDDGAVVYSKADSTSTGSSLWRQSLEDDRVTPTGSPSLFLSSATTGVVYRRGAFDPPEGSISVNPDSLAFGAVELGGISDASLTVSNAGTADLMINSLLVEGTNASQFEVSSGACTGQTLKPSGTCTVTVAFSPTSAGVKTGSLMIESDDPNTPTLNVALTGTGRALPAVATDPPTSVTSSSANLNGKVNPNGSTATYHFEYGTTVGYGSTTPITSAGSGTSEISVTANIAGLGPDTTYHYRIVATNTAGTSYGFDQTLTTLNCIPPQTPASISYPSSDDDGSFPITWSPVTGATTYTLERATNSSFNNATTVYGGANTSWNESALGDGTYYYRVSAANSCGNSDWRDGSAIVVSSTPVPMISLSPSSISNSCLQGQNAPVQSFEVWNSGEGVLSYNISDDADWISFTTVSGTSSGEHDTITVNYSTYSMPQGTYSATITISASGASNSPQTIAVTLVIRGTQNKGPTADAGFNQTANEGDTVTLDGSSSSDPDDGIASYSWNQISGQQVVISDPGVPKATFVAPAMTQYDVLTFVFELTVTDYAGSESSDTVSVTLYDNGITGFPDDVVTMKTSTLKSIGFKVDSGGDIVGLTAVDPMTVGDTVDRPENLIYGLVEMILRTHTVGGTVSVTAYLEDPAPAGYRMYQYDPNAGWYDYSDYVVFNAAREQFTFTLIDGGTGDHDNAANRTVYDPFGLGLALSPASPPTANAGPDQTVNEGSNVSLDGSNSSDPDDDIASYIWTQTGGSQVTLSDSSAEQPTFTAPDVGAAGESLTFELTVTDSTGLSDTDSVIINVTEGNLPPTADAGLDQEVEEGGTVTLTGLASFDPEGAVISYLWTQTGGIEVSLSDPSAVEPTFVSPEVGPAGESLTFELTVTDSGGLQSTDTCIVNVTWLNDPPTADAGSDHQVEEGDTVTLDGSGSTDPDDGIISYLWTQTEGPSVTLSSPSAVTSTFEAPEVDEETSLTFQLTVTDNGSLQSTDTCAITVTTASSSGGGGGGGGGCFIGTATDL
jgi:Zn-dependent metalloprotease